MKRVVAFAALLGLAPIAACTDADVASSNLSRAADQKHFLGLSDNVTYFAEQVEDADVSVYHYRVIFKPQTILPDVDFVGSASDLTTNRN